MGDLTKPIQILSAGRKQCSDGRWFEFSEADLTAMQAAFAGAPMVPGHPPDDQPVGGYARAIALDGSVLQITEYGDVDPIFAAFVNRTAANRCSVKLRLPDHPDNDSGTYQVRHIGFLDNPADQALQPAEFAQCDEHEAIFTVFDPNPSATTGQGRQDNPKTTSAGAGGGNASGSPETHNLNEAEFMATLAATLSQALEAKEGMTVADLAQAGGIDESTMQSILSGEIQTPPDERLQGFSTALDLSFDDLKALVPSGDSADAGMSAPSDQDAALAARAASLEQREAEFARAQKIDPWLEEQITAHGRLLPGEKAGFRALFAKLDDGLEIEFARGDGTVKQSAATFLKTFIGSLGKRGPVYDELTPKGDDADLSAPTPEKRTRAVTSKKYRQARTRQ